MRRMLLLLCLLSLTACGFQLRGNYPLPFDTLYISLPDTSPLYAALKRSIESSSKTRIVDDPKDAQATFTVVSDRYLKNILSLSGTGRVREYQLVRQFTFRVHTFDGRDFIPQNEVILRRDLPFSDTAVLSKEAEEQLLQRDMQGDLVQQLMRRLAAAKVTAVEPVKVEPANAAAR